MTVGIDVIIPYWRDTAGREELFRYTSDRWIELHHKTHGARVYASDGGGLDGDGRFNRGRARNAAAALGDGEWLVLWDTDVPPPSDERLSSAIRNAGRSGWSPVFGRTVVFSPHGTRRLLDAMEAGFAFAPGPGDMLAVLPLCKGPTVVKRRVFEAIGGYDERFTGWGFEDTALRSVLGAMYGQPEPAPMDAVCWSLSLDPPTDKRGESAENRELYFREYHGLDRGSVLDLLERRRQPAAG